MITIPEIQLPLAPDDGELAAFPLTHSSFGILLWNGSYTQRRVGFNAVTLWTQRLQNVWRFSLLLFSRCSGSILYSLYTLPTYGPRWRININLLLKGSLYHSFMFWNIITHHVQLFSSLWPVIHSVCTSMATAQTEDDEANVGLTQQDVTANKTTQQSHAFQNSFFPVTEC